jgi:hypothetical protein
MYSQSPEGAYGISPGQRLGKINPIRSSPEWAQANSDCIKIKQKFYLSNSIFMPKQTKTHLIPLIIEKGDGALWGHTRYKDDLIVDIGKNPEELMHKIKKTLVGLHGLPPDELSQLYFTIVSK